MLRCGVLQGLTHDTLYFWANKHLFPLVIGGLNRRPCVPVRVRGHLYSDQVWCSWALETLWIAELWLVDPHVRVAWEAALEPLFSPRHPSSTAWDVKKRTLSSGFVEKACGVFLWGLAILDHTRFHDSTCGEGGLSVMQSGSPCLGGMGFPTEKRETCWRDPAGLFFLYLPFRLENSAEVAGQRDWAASLCELRAVASLSALELVGSLEFWPKCTCTHTHPPNHIYVCKYSFSNTKANSLISNRLPVTLFQAVQSIESLPWMDQV